MKIIIDKGGLDQAVVHIDTKTCKSPRTIREAMITALKLDGYLDAFIDKVFLDYSKDVDVTIY